MARKYFHLSEEEKAPFIIQLYNKNNQISLAEVFGNSNPVEIEIGFGKGAFLKPISISTGFEFPNTSANEIWLFLL